MKAISYVFGVSLILLTLSSCRTVQNGNGGGEISEDERSRNALLTRRVEMLERQNGVLKDENTTYRRDVLERDAKIEKLNADMNSMKLKLESDIQLLTKKVENLTEQKRILEQQSGEKIRELSELNQKISTELGDEIKRLNDTLKERENQFNNERERLRREFAGRELEINREKDELGKKLETAVSRVQVVENELALAQKRIEKLQSDRTDSQSRIDALKSNLAAITEELDLVRKKLEKAESAVDDRNSGTGGPGAEDQKNE
jgi:chromosome segregation ATPase